MHKQEIEINILKYICILQFLTVGTSLQKVLKHELDHAKIKKNSNASLVEALLCNSFTGSRN